MIYGKGLISRSTLEHLRTVLTLITGDNKTKLTPKEMVDKIQPLFDGKNKVIQGILDRRISSIDLEACGVRELGDYALANCRELESIKIPSGVSRIDKTAFEGSWIKSIEVDNIYNAIPYAPWGASMAKGDVVWLQAEKLPVTLVQAPHQTIVATVDGKEFTSSFEYYQGAEISFKSVADDGYAPGELSMTEAYLDSPIEVTVTDAVEMQVSRRLEFPNPIDGPEDGFLFGGLVLNNGEKLYFKYKISGDLYMVPSINGRPIYAGTLRLLLSYPLRGDYREIKEYFYSRVKTSGGTFSCNVDFNKTSAYIYILVSDATSDILPLADGGPGYIEFLPNG